MTDKEMPRTKLDELQEELITFMNGGAVLSLAQHNTSMPCEVKHGEWGVLPSYCVAYSEKQHARDVRRIRRY